MHLTPNHQLNCTAFVLDVHCTRYELWLVWANSFLLLLFFFKHSAAQRSTKFIFTSLVFKTKMNCIILKMQFFHYNYIKFGLKGHWNYFFQTLWKVFLFFLICNMHKLINKWHYNIINLLEQRWISKDLEGSEQVRR